MARYGEIEDLLRIGAYRQGSDPAVDEAIERMPDILSFLRQKKGEVVAFEEAITQLINLARERQ